MLYPFSDFNIKDKCEIIFPIEILVYTQERMTRNDAEFLRAYIEIIKFLLDKGEWVETKQIRDFLSNLGILQGNYENKRRKLNNYLNHLHTRDYIEKQISGRSNRWKINERMFTNIISLSDKEKDALLLSLTFTPEEYKKFEYQNVIKNILRKAGEKISEEKEFILNNAFTNIPLLHTGNYPYDFQLVDTLIEDILKKRVIKIRYKNKTKDIIPLKIVYFHGALYLLAKRIGNTRYSTYRLGCIKRIGVVNEVEDTKIFYRGSSRTPLNFEDEEPFPFAVKLPDYYGVCGNSGKFKVFYTQFHIEKLTDNSYKAYLLGFSSRRFFPAFSYLEIEEIYPPDEDMIAIMGKYLPEEKENLIKVLTGKKLDTLLETDLQTLQKRFLAFIKDYNKFLENRKQKLSKFVEQ
ncbi:WYL domain-containing protein [Persephonella sp.]|nr:WYL domain-containing protein [Persephonella sp.]